jgi:heterodisulfide reductase subunit C
MAKFRTAMGKVVDMSALQSRNEKVRAVGNMNVNARGDTIDGYGRVIKPVTTKVNEAYSNTVGNRSSHNVKSKNKPEPAKPKIDMSELTEIEKEIEASHEEDAEIEEIRAQEIKSKLTKKQ